jgi:hypothetical protein
MWLHWQAGEINAEDAASLGNSPCNKDLTGSIKLLPVHFQ